MNPVDVPEVFAPHARAAGRPRDQVAHDAILDAALSLLDECCYSAITVEKIAARAGVGKPTIYRRWKTKAELVMEAYAARVSSTVPPMIPSDNVFADLLLYLDRMFTVNAHPVNNRILRCFIAESQFDDSFRAKFYEVFISRRRAGLIKLLNHGKAIGQIRPDLDLEVAVDIVYGAYSSRMMTNHAPIDHAYAEQVVAMLQNGFAVASARQ
jgi:AcrR family transcriptional regulator